LILSPDAVYTTVRFLGIPGASFDLASLSFHVPRFEFAAKHIVKPTKSDRNVRRAVLVFMLSPG
jgi:hypothetical protein